MTNGDLILCSCNIVRGWDELAFVVLCCCDILVSNTQEIPCITSDSPAGIELSFVHKGSFLDENMPQNEDFGLLFDVMAMNL